MSVSAHLWPEFGKMSYMSISWSAESLLSTETSDFPSVSLLPSTFPLCHFCHLCTGSRELVGARQGSLGTASRGTCGWVWGTEFDNCFNLSLNKPTQLKPKIITICSSFLQPPPPTQCIFSKSRSIRKTPYQFHGRRSLSTVCLWPSDHCILIFFLS